MRPVLIASLFAGALALAACQKPAEDKAVETDAAATADPQAAVNAGPAPEMPDDAPPQEEVPGAEVPMDGASPPVDSAMQGPIPQPVPVEGRSVEKSPG